MIHINEIHKCAFAKAYYSHLLIAVFLITTASNAQSITKPTFSNGGGDLANADATISLTLGEPIVGIISNGESISQGFWAGVSEGETLSIENAIALNETITAYPNPVKNELTILSDRTEGFQLEIYDLLGKLVIKDQYQGDTLQKLVDLSGLPSGMYHIHLTNDHQHLKTIKILKE